MKYPFLACGLFPAQMVRNDISHHLGAQCPIWVIEMVTIY